MKVDFKPLILSGIVVFALLIMGIGLAFRQEFKAMASFDQSSILKTP